MIKIRPFKISKSVISNLKNHVSHKNICVTNQQDEIRTLPNLNLKKKIKKQEFRKLDLEKCNFKFSQTPFRVERNLNNNGWLNQKFAHFWKKNSKCKAKSNSLLWKRYWIVHTSTEPRYSRSQINSESFALFKISRSWVLCSS